MSHSTIMRQLTVLKQGTWMGKTTKQTSNYQMNWTVLVEKLVLVLLFLHWIKLSQIVVTELQF